MKYYSNVLCKPYNSIKGAKTALSRYKNQIEEEYNDVKTCRLSGWKLYLGDPIAQREKTLKNELFDIQNELNGLNTFK